MYVSDWPTGVRAGGRPLVVEDLLFVQEGELEHTNRAAITEIFREIAPKYDWSLEFAMGKTGQILVDASKHSRLGGGLGESCGFKSLLLGRWGVGGSLRVGRRRSSPPPAMILARGRRTAAPSEGGGPAG